MKAVNLFNENVMLFKNQKVGILTDIVDCSEPLNISSETDCPAVSYVSDNLHKGNLEDVGTDLSGSDLSGTQKGQLQNLLLSYNDVFSKGKRNIGKYSAGVQHHIPLKTGVTPVKQPLRRVPFTYQEGVKSDLKAMLEDGVIEKSNSKWASPLVIVKKPSGDLRICVDYRKLNEASRVTCYPLPNMTATLDRLADVKFFMTIHMVSSYHQIEVAPVDRHKTAFVSPFGLFQYCRLPFGLAGAPGTFQAVIEDMLQVLDAEDVMAYFDDVICFHSTFEEHLKGIERLLLTIRKSGFKGFAHIAAPLHDLLNKPEFVWTPQCDIASNVLRKSSALQ